MMGKALRRNRRCSNLIKRASSIHGSTKSLFFIRRYIYILCPGTNCCYCGELRSVSTALSIFGLRCSVRTKWSLCISGNIVVNCVISASLGILMPAAGDLPVIPSTHSLTTEPPLAPPFCWAPSVGPPRLAAEAAAGVRAVVMTSSLCGRLPLSVSTASSGSARLDRRAGRREPMRGSRYLDAKDATQGGSLYPLRLAKSERYIWPARMPIIDAAADPGRCESASCNANTYAKLLLVRASPKMRKLYEEGTILEY